MRKVKEKGGEERRRGKSVQWRDLTAIFHQTDKKRLEVTQK